MKVQQLIDFLKRCNPEVEIKFQFDDGYEEYTDFYITEIHKLNFNTKDEKYVRIVITQ